MLPDLLCLAVYLSCSVENSFVNKLPEKIFDVE